LRIISCYVLISEQSPLKFPASKVAGIVDSKVGVATCITRTDPTDLAETSVKQQVPSTSDRNVETELKQVSSSSSANDSAAGHVDEIISLHEDQSLRVGEAQPCVSRPAAIQHMDSAATCSINCINLHSSLMGDSSGSLGFLQHSTYLHLVYFIRQIP